MLNSIQLVFVANWDLALKQNSKFQQNKIQIILNI